MGSNTIRLPASATERAAFKRFRQHGYGPEAALSFAKKLEAQPSNLGRVVMLGLLGWKAPQASRWLRGCGYYRRLIHKGD